MTENPKLKSKEVSIDPIELFYYSCGEHRRCLAGESGVDEISAFSAAAAAGSAKVGLSETPKCQRG